MKWRRFRLLAMSALVMTPELAEDVRRLAEATGLTPEEAVADAVRERLYLVKPVSPLRTKEKPTVEEILALAKAITGGRKRLMTDDEALGYDGYGIWTS